MFICGYCGSGGGAGFLLQIPSKILLNCSNRTKTRLKALNDWKWRACCHFGLIHCGLCWLSVCQSACHNGMSYLTDWRTHSKTQGTREQCYDKEPPNVGLVRMWTSAEGFWFHSPPKSSWTKIVYFFIRWHAKRITATHWNGTGQTW